MPAGQRLALHDRRVLAPNLHHVIEPADRASLEMVPLTDKPAPPAPSAPSSGGDRPATVPVPRADSGTPTP